MSSVKAAAIPPPKSTTSRSTYLLVALLVALASFASIALNNQSMTSLTSRITTFIKPVNTSSLRAMSTSTASVPSGSASRSVSKAVLAIEQAEGAGARVRRSIGTHLLRNLSPFLMLDHFKVS